jgi:hypothetical protein
MRRDHPWHPSQNPFFNRFHDPVHRRHDDMENNTNTDEPNAITDFARDKFGVLFALVALAISFVLLLRAF